LFIFEANSRVQKVAEGIQFYEPDVLCSGYAFTGNQKIIVRLDYTSPGFGIVLVENNGEKLEDAFNSYLLKIGSNDFRVLMKHFKEQEQIHVESAAIAPGEAMKDITLVFELTGEDVKIVRQTADKNGGIIESVLAGCKLPKAFRDYRIGFYSNAGNIIRSVIFQNSVPQHWHVSVKNTMGGRVSFERDLVRIENCEHYAEIEQKSIPLPAGEYWLKYETEKVNGKCDVKAYIIDPENHGDGRERNLEDEYKNILEDDGSFIIESPMDINLKFKAHDGIIRNISIMDNIHSSFIETRGRQQHQDCSDITIDLHGIRRVTWYATIYDAPPWDDFTKDCPYSIIDSGDPGQNMQDLNLRFNIKYQFIFEVFNSTLTIVDGAGNTIARKTIVVSDNKIRILWNTTSTIYRLLLTRIDNKQVDALCMKTFKKFVPSAITGPIIVTKVNSTESFELSCSYREVVNPCSKIQLFPLEHPLILSEDIPVNAASVKVYGIPQGARINLSATEIKKFTTAYHTISDTDFTKKGNTVVLKDGIREMYEYIAVAFTSIQDFDYEFTNYEREVFSGTNYLVSLAYPVAKRDEDIIVYGIPADSDVHEEYFHRVPSDALINSIDYYADRYDIVLPSAYVIDYDMHEIMLDEKIVDGRYRQIVVDYLKKDSYAINFRNDQAQYELDISTEENRVQLHYDMREDGAVSDYVRTNITPDKDKYIVLKRVARRNTDEN